ncbi:hypothetical protein [Xanthomonas phage RTH11]|nr:hypothetical protein [Xanthomonas phage RTH11]
MSRDFKRGYKQYVRTEALPILRFVEAEVARGNSRDLGDYAELSMFDLRGEVCFRLMFADRMVGFATAKCEGLRKRLLRIYVMPEFRRHGIASWVLDEMPITEINVPVRCIQLLSLCRKKGYVYTTRQYTTHVAELTRPNIKASHLSATSNRIPSHHVG